MTATLDRAGVEDLLFREAACLDRGEWQEWLDLYAEDALFWVPAWRDELTPTSDPDRELSLIYYDSRAGLADRVFRATSGQSVASLPRPRCVHCISNVMITRSDPGEVAVTSNFVVHLHDVRAARSHSFFGRYDHRLRRSDGRWLIAAKTILLLNDTIPTVVDFYSI
jgi:benzoate/toluate 1,2-dioxygenase beta subunit